jgi:predicted SAM-dependent methyltransferase
MNLGADGKGTAVLARKNKTWRSWLSRATLGRFFLAVPSTVRSRAVVELMASLTIEEQRSTLESTRTGGEMREQCRRMHEQCHSLREFADRVRKLRRVISTAQPRNVVVGAGGSGWPGWASLEHEILDIAKVEDWEVLFDPMSVDRILMEHVLEHLEESECRAALALCYKHLRPGGLLRIAVPDGYRRDEKYRLEVEPPKDGHRMLFNKDTLSRMLKEHNFQVELLEYFDENDTFYAHAWDESEGLVRRSVRFDDQVEFRRGGLCYTSLIVDARKKSIRGVQ